MKKITITVFALALSMCGFAQKKLVRSAEGYLYEQPINFEQAIKDIEAAMKDPSSSNMAYTYDVAGQIYYKLYETEAVKREGKMQYNQDMMSENLVKAIDAYLKCGELDQLPDEKGKVKSKYLKNVKKNVATYANYLLVEGQQHQGKNEIDKAFNLYNKYLDLPSNNIMKDEGIDKSDVYNDVKFLAVNLAAQDEKKRPIMIKYMEELKNASYKEETMYEWLCDAYSKDKQNDKMISTVNEGLKKFPSNKYLIGNLINFYLNNDKKDEATKYLNEAIGKDPSNPQYYKIKGMMLLKEEKFDEAVTSLSKAVELNPSDFDAQFECGLAYEKKGEKIIEKANSIKDIKKYNAERSKGTAELKNSLPFFEKAREINGEDLDNLQFLRSVYYKLGMNDKYKEINKKYEEVKAKK
ncbi:MAG: tetratricopeptide repeat protein [Paludibacteraceae bacterium]|jgi:Tetratricopeptide repeat.|nr:tetratricopeptide repeat protein [Paludibacteraceae bacterium]